MSKPGLPEGFPCADKNSGDAGKPVRRAYDDRRIPSHAGFYVDNLLAEYETTVTTKPDLTDEVESHAYDLAVRIRNKPQPWSWADLYALEIAISRLQRPERLRSRIYLLRDKYRSLVGDPTYEAYQKSSKLSIDDADIDLLRSEIETLLREFHWHFSATNARDELFYDLRRNMIVPLFAYGLLVVAYTWYQVANGHAIPALLVVILAGVTGAFASIMRRLQLAQQQTPLTVGDSVTNLASLGLGQLSVYLALASGAIFPVVLLLMFVGGMLQGALFPEMYSPSGAGEGLTFLDFALDTGPVSGVDFGKLFVWSFIAGFAERFVPDVLDKVASKGSKSSGDAGK